MFLPGAPTSLSHKPITFHENKLASGWTQNRTEHFHYCKYWTGISPYFLNAIVMPSLSNYNTRSKMALDIPLRRANKGQKIMLFLGAKIWNMLNSNIKAVQLSFFHTQPEKRNSWKNAIVSNFIDFCWQLIFFSSGEP